MENNHTETPENIEAGNTIPEHTDPPVERKKCCGGSSLCKIASFVAILISLVVCVVIGYQVFMGGPESGKQEVSQPPKETETDEPTEEKDVNKRRIKKYPEHKVY